MFVACDFRQLNTNKLDYFVVATLNYIREVFGSKPLKGVVQGVLWHVSWF